MGKIAATHFEGQDLSRLDRKHKKPLMEKKRRKRINDCMDELKNLVLAFMKKDPSNTAKLEKADVLELTRDLLQRLNMTQINAAISTDVAARNHFFHGWKDCIRSTMDFFNTANNTDPNLKLILRQHLESFLPIQPLMPQMAAIPGSGAGLNVLFDANMAYQLDLLHTSKFQRNVYGNVKHPIKPASSSSSSSSSTPKENDSLLHSPSDNNSSHSIWRPFLDKK